MDNNIMHLDVSALVQKAEDLAFQLTKDKLKTNQIRNFYSAVMQMRTDFALKGFTPALEQKLVMLKPKLAYAAGRQSAVRNNFYPQMKMAIEGVIQSGKNTETLEKFFLFVESVVAYHKFYGGE